jgi:hypothetical protein
LTFSELNRAIFAGAKLRRPWNAPRLALKSSLYPRAATTSFTTKRQDNESMWVYKLAIMVRELVWVEKADFHGLACSACAWESKTSVPLTSNTLEEKKTQHEQLRYEEFKAHVCAKHPKKTA